MFIKIYAPLLFEMCTTGFLTPKQHRNMKILRISPEILWFWYQRFSAKFRGQLLLLLEGLPIAKQESVALCWGTLYTA